MKQTKRVLSVVLALAMVFAMSIMVSAADPAELAASISKDGDTVTVTITTTKAGDMASFMVGIAFDKEKVAPVELNTEKEVAVWGAKMTQTIKTSGVGMSGNYVNIGGTHMGDTLNVDANEVVATVQFKAKGEGTGDFVVKVNPTKQFSLDNDEEGTRFKEDEIPTPAPVPSETASETPSEAPASAAPSDTTTTTVPSAAPSAAAPSVAPSAAATKAPKTADTASVVIPVVAIVAAAAAVVVVSKKRVEE